MVGEYIGTMMQRRALLAALSRMNNGGVSDQQITTLILRAKARGAFLAFLNNHEHLCYVP